MKARRPHIPVLVKLHAALLQLGLEPHEVELDHDPALALRPIDPETGDTIPPANDPRYLVWRTKADHAVKTTGRKGGSRKGDQANGDIQRVAKVKRILQRNNTDPDKPLRQKRTIPSRPFPKREKKK